MIQAIQARNFGIGNSLFSNAATHTKSCCQKIQEVFQKAWKAFKRAIDALLKPCYRCWHNSKMKNRLSNNRRIFELFQAEAQGLPNEQLAKGFLFEILDNARTSKGYIFGSVHYLPQNLHHWHASILEKFSQSTHLGVEQLVHDYDLIERQENPLREGILQYFNDPALDQNRVAGAAEQTKLACIRLGIVTTREIEEQDRAVQLRSRDLPENEVFKSKSRWNLQFYGQKLGKRAPGERGVDYYHGADERLVAAARQQNKPIIPLENEVIRNEYYPLLLIKQYQAMLGKNVEELLRDCEENRQRMEQILDLWQRGDFSGFERFEQLETERLQRVPDPALRALNLRSEELNRGRNIQMADTIDQFIRGRGAKLFAAFGSLHLVGQDGVIELLRQRGWTVQQVGAPQIQVPEVPLQAAVGA